MKRWGIIIAVGLIVLISSCSNVPGPEERSKVFLIGLDAVDWYLLDPLMADGDLPNLKILVDRGVRSKLLTVKPTSSPVIWNSIATGKTRDKHGIVSFTRRVEGEFRVFTSNMVKTWRIWDLLNQNGLRTNVIGWWTTWPAQAVDGNLVSSYVSLDRRSWKGSLVSKVPNQTYPTALFKELEPLINGAKTIMEQRVERIFGMMEEEEFTAATRSNFEDTKWCLLSDEIFHRVALYLQQENPAQFFSVYLSGVDVIGHRFWKYMEPDAFDEYVLTEEEVAQFGESIRRYYRLMDEFIGEYMTLADEDTTFVIVSDHGMRAYPPSSNKFVADRTGAHDNAEPGVLILSGKNIRQHVTLKQPPSIYDVAPTVLYLMGVPVDETMDGKVILGAVEQAFVERYPVRAMKYKEKAAGEEGFIQSEAEGELIKRLKALGYIE